MSQTYIHHLIKNIEMQCDGIFSRAFLTDKDTFFYTHSPQMLMDFLMDKGIKLPEFDVFQRESLYSIRFDIQLLKDKEGKKMAEYAIKSVKEKINDENDHSYSLSIKKIEEYFNKRITMDRDPLLNRFYNMDYVFSAEFKSPFIDLLNFDSSMFSTNNFYFPAMNGEQEGNPEATRMLSKVILDALKQE